MKVSRRFTADLPNPYADQDWVTRKSEIREPDGRVVFSQENVKVPSSWSQVATDILTQKYFRRTGVPLEDGNTGGEEDARQVFHRLAGCWTDWGKRYGYFDTGEDADIFYEELCYMLSHQMAAPNSPQWFNTGLHTAYGIEGPAQGHYYVDPKSGKLKKSKNAYEHPQPHACFIQGVEDNLVNGDGVMDLWLREARLFKYGSGSGSNFSQLRAEGEPLSGGGRSSGLMSFLRVGDRAAGAIKSGGTTRRAAKMVCLDLDHPEILNFIEWKMVEEQKVSALVAGSQSHLKHIKAVANSCFDDKGTLCVDPKTNAPLRRALISARGANVPDNYLAKVLQMVKMGRKEISFPLFDVDWQGDAYSTVSGQNANNSVRVPNRFFEALERGEDWELKYRTSGAVAESIPAAHLWDTIGQAAWSSADPGLQFDTTINEWHTCPEDGPIRASNPCSEYMFLDDTACNLASLNLLKFYEDGEFDINGFRHAVQLWTMVLEISVLMAQFPSQAIAERSYAYRTLGLGYANLGALLMSMGIPYGSERAQGVTGAITAILTGESYATSAEMAKELGPFPRYGANREAMLRVIANHRRAAFGAGEEEYDGLTCVPQAIDQGQCPAPLLAAAHSAWDRAWELGQEYGFRNAQVSVIAPTGTIGLVMDCDTTGIEPDFALVKFKKLAGGGYFKIINQSVPRALGGLGYAKDQVQEIQDYCVGRGTLRGAPFINTESLQRLGFQEEHLTRLEKELPTAFDIRFAFSPWTLGEEFCRETLGLSAADLARPDFDFLGALGFDPDQIEAANRFVCGSMTVEGAPHLREEHYAVFDCANKCGRYSQRFLSVDAHLNMMASAQPFISGAISKTINMPAEATIEEVQEAYLKGWRRMLKAISIYRDGSKLSQPLSTSAMAGVFADLNASDQTEGEEAPIQTKPKTQPEVARADVTELAKKLAVQLVRRELPARRYGYTVKATIGGQRVYLRTGEYEDGALGEIFVDMYKEGAAYRSLMNAFSIAVSLGLQYGVPLEEFVSKFHLFRFEPNGHVADHDSIKFCSSIIDFIFRDLALNYLGRTDMVHVPPEGKETASLGTSYGGGAGAAGAVGMGASAASAPRPAASSPSQGSQGMDMALTQEEWKDDELLAAKLARVQGYEGDPCTDCGQFKLVRAGTCLRCVSCGGTSGCS